MNSKTTKDKQDLESFECFYDRFLREHSEDLEDPRKIMYWGWIARKFHEDSLETMARLGIGNYSSTVGEK